MYFQCIRELKSQSPSPLKKGESDRPSVCTCSGCQCTSASWNLWATVQKEATVQDVYAVYKMRVISQNSRRKAITEGQTVSWNSPPPPSEVWVGYRRKTRKAGAEDESSCVRVCTAPCTLRSGHKKKMHRAARVQISTSESGLCTSMYVSTLEIAGNGPKCVRCVQNARNFSK